MPPPYLVGQRAFVIKGLYRVAGVESRNQFCRLPQMLVKQLVGFLKAGTVTLQRGNKIEQGEYRQDGGNQEYPD